MNINHENYESYFLMYVDNELSPDQKKIVEMFVKSNPQLKREWDEIMATIQVPDEAVIFSEKSSLLKTPMDHFIDEHNYSGRFTEYHDKELSENEKSFVETFLEKHPPLKKEFEYLGIARFTPDLSIQFTEKEKLYHHTAKVHAINIWRSAAAAVIGGLLLWSGYRIINSSQQRQNPPAVANHPAKPESNQLPGTAPDGGKNTAALPEQKSVQQTAVPLKNTGKEIVAKKELAAKNNSVRQVNQISENTLAQNPEIESPELETGIAINDLPTPEIISSGKIIAESASDEFLNQASQPQSINPAILQDDNSDNRYVFTDIPSDRIRQSKLGIFIKKIRRTIDRTNPINRLFNEDND